MLAYAALVAIESGDSSAATKEKFDQHKADLGYGLLLKKYTPNVVNATDSQVTLAAADTIPKVAPLFWAFRGMVGLGFLFLFIFAASFLALIRKRLAPQRWLLRLCVVAIPLPWVAVELGWFVSEYGRQPWTISDTLPTALSVSSISTGQVWTSLIGICTIYTLLFITEMYLMLKYIRLGPDSVRHSVNSAH